MNYFHLDNDPKKSVQYLHDVHLRKMCTETAQMLSTSLWITDCDFAESAYARGELMLPAYEHHPCTKWCAVHIEYMSHYFKCILDEYEFRFNKKHVSSRILTSIPWGVFWADIVNIPPCMPKKYHSVNVVWSYRKYYISEKQHDKNGKFIANYTRREKPYWL